MSLQLEVLKELSIEERDATFQTCRKQFLQLSRRYLPEHTSAAPDSFSVMALDVIRGSWRLDARKSKMSSVQANQALGFAFGEFLCSALGMRWCVTRDNWGDTLSVVYEAKAGPADAPETVAIDPINFVAKRESIENVEVFSDGFAALQGMVRGGNA